MRVTVHVLALLFLMQHAQGVWAKGRENDLRITVQSRVACAPDSGTYEVAGSVQLWKPSETAVIITDMWDSHWCPSATARVAELAPPMNRLLAVMREKGLLIVHAPSDCMDYYRDHPARKAAMKYSGEDLAPLTDGTRELPSEAGALWPVDASDGGCEDAWAKYYRAWTRQTDALTIADKDLVSDDGAQIGECFRQRGIKNVILMGVHANMCIVARSFGLRAMKRLGLNVVLMRDMTDLMYNPESRPHTSHFNGLNLMVEYIEKYICPTVASSDFTGKEPFLFDRMRNIRLPQSDGHYRETKSYVEDEPDSDYIHASQEAYESFRDIKFAVRLHWGIYSIWQMNHESWGFLDFPNEKKQEYNSLYKTFNPTGFDAQEWMSFFLRSGIQSMAFTTKHHEGFSMFHTKTRVRQRANYLDTLHLIEPCDLAYSIEETPFKRDIVRELCDAAHKNNIKIDLYFSHPDWYDADFRPYNYHPLSTPDVGQNPGNYYNWHGNNRGRGILTPNKTPEETERMIARHREQLRELLTNYGKIDMVCLDQWFGRDVWPHTKETVKMMRKLQPDVMLRCRGIGNYGDYYTPERFVPGNKANTDMPWITIYGLASTFSYDANGDNYKGAPWIIHNIIECAAKGGGFMVGIGPDGNGKFHPKAVEQLEETGRWLKINGRGIYETRDRSVWKEGDFYFTRSKDHKKVYAFTEKWEGNELTIPSVTPRRGSDVYLFGHKKPLKWRQTEDGVRIELPENKPCEHAWGFQMETE
ncbi:MAG: alpha-L-fucosidase [Rikenellaceae bacterium]|nr:alpha-L-fucosidase [Rikenellaceae bacterium]